jgi:hypothetical protein
MDELKKAIHPNIDDYYSWKSNNRRKAIGRARAKSNGLVNSGENSDYGSENSPTRTDFNSPTRIFEDAESEINTEIGGATSQNEHQDFEAEDLKEIQLPLEEWLYACKMKHHNLIHR